MLYRITVASEPTEDELFAAIEFVLDDGYYLHTVGFYQTVEETDGPYTVAMIEQTADNTLSLKHKDGDATQRPVKE